MKARWFLLPLLAIALTAASFAQQPDASQQTGGGRWGSGPGMMGGGIVGTVTEVASDHYTVKTLEGDIYTVHYSANTRIMKMPPMPAGAQNESGEQRGFMRTPPTPIKASDIKVGDTITVRGEVDSSAKSVGAIAVVQLDPERVQRLRAMQESFGKTWLAGRITAIQDTKVTVEGGPNHEAYTFVADENTTFRRRREPITMADLQVGDNVRVEGALKGGQFVASSVTLMMPRPNGGPAQRQGPPPQ